MAKKPVLTAANLPDADKADLYQALDAWYKLNAQLSVLIDKEMELRKAITERFFAGCTEGTNTMVLDYGKVLKADIKINRSVDANQLEALKLAARNAGMTSVLAAVDVMFNYKPSLVIGEWKAANDEIRKAFADVVTEKPGAPALTIETPKR